VPAAAVIPAPMAYLPIVAVEALVATVPTVPLRGRAIPLAPAVVDLWFPTLRNAMCKPRTAAFVACSGARQPLGCATFGCLPADCSLCHGAACTMGRAVKCIDPRGAPGGKGGRPVPSHRSRTKEWSAKPIRDRCSPFGQLYVQLWAVPACRRHELGPVHLPSRNLQLTSSYAVLWCLWRPCTLLL